MEPKIHSDRQNRTVHKATFYESDLMRLAEEGLAAAVGVSLKAAHVSVRTYWTTHQDGSLAVARPCLQLELTVDHAKEAEAGP